jgi:RNA polymerase sigma factor (sigma-70 family)
MEEADWLGARFDAERGRLVGLAYRMLGSRDDAEDAVQESWLRLSRADRSAVENLGGWLTTVVSRVCLDQLRFRRNRGQQSWPADHADQPEEASPQAGPEQQVLLAESVGMAMLVVLDTLEPAERVAFVLHDMFAVRFEEIGGILDRSPAAARQLASRARRRVRGQEAPEDNDRLRQARLVQDDIRVEEGEQAPGLGGHLRPAGSARGSMPCSS